MANITVSFAEMEQAATQLGAARDEITDRLHAMQSRIGELVSSGFVTERASVRFENAYEEFTSSATSVISSLSEMQSYLSGSADALRELDAQMAARIA